VKQIAETNEVRELLALKYSKYDKKWEATKRKLLANPLLRGLNFKPGSDDGPDAYSVRVDEGFRAHLRNQGHGSWRAYNLGPHGKMGHG
jgi:hypothetical protein